MRQIVLDTETTGLDPKQGHRIIEIGCIELINREATGNVYHQYINPQREVEQGAFQVHGISNEFLHDKPIFAAVIHDFIEFIRDSELIIHNADFDVGFINHEFKLIDKKYGKTTDYCKIFDTLALARQLHPGRKNSLDALCKRYEVDNSERDFHGALLDAKILSQVYLIMTGGQVALFDDNHETHSSQVRQHDNAVTIGTVNNIPVIKASDDELKAHQEFLATISKASGFVADW